MALRVSRILHAGYVFECDGAHIAFDPLFENPFSVNCHAFPRAQFDRVAIGELRLSAVFISHFHDDHCSLESLASLDRRTPIYMYCVHPEIFEMIGALGFARVYPLELGKKVSVGPFEVTPHRALDEDIDSIFHVVAQGMNVLNVVDSWIGEETLRTLVKTPWDLVLWPFQPMRELEILSPSRAEPSARALPPEWLERIAALKPRAIVPSSCQFKFESWSWLNRAFFPVSYALFETAIAAVSPTTKVLRLDPSESLVLNAASIERAETLPWIQADRGGDYDYVHETPPTTAEIGRNFNPLMDHQLEMVEKFCREELPRKFRELGPPTGDYFKKRRHWKLSLYDHDGEATDYHFGLHEDSMDPVADAAPQWTTEIPVAKLYGALFDGESLTSIYLRINDVPFDPKTEAELRDADVMDDPLMRCLYGESVGSYQKAQLRRLGVC